ncbi:MAG: HPF/RaiA family ribosome-associated protein [Flavobacteriales bacterium]
MQTNINSIHFSADKKLINFIEKKIKKMSLFNNSLLSADVFLKFEPSDSSENKLVEIKVMTNNSEHFASKQSKTFEEATDLSIEALRKQIIKNKEKKRS